MKDNGIIEATDAAEALAGLSGVGPWWATLDAACWQPTMEGHGQPERGAERAMLVSASVARGASLGRRWRETGEGHGGTAVRMPDGSLLAPVGGRDEPSATVADAHAIASRLIAKTGAHLTWTYGAYASYDCARRHLVGVPASPDWGSTGEDLAALVGVLAWDLTMRRGSARHPPELVAGLASAFALSDLGVDPSVGRRAKMRIERPRCLDTTRWRPAITDDPDLMLSAADEAELVAGELLRPVRDCPPATAATVTGDHGQPSSHEGTDEDGRDEGDADDDQDQESDGRRCPSAGTYTLGDVAATARAASRALSRQRRGMRPW